jgi:DNA-binding NarL/FixJ family response regulator
MEKGPITVLLADDDEGFLASLRALVERQAELRVVAAVPNGVEAVAAAARLTPDAAVIDLHMPLLAGVATIARLRQDHPNVCLIALTGDHDAELHQAARKAGADAVIRKGELVGILLDRLQKSRAA